MVILHVKHDQYQFLYDTKLDKPVDDVIKDITAIYNGRLKVSRICAEMEELAKYGTLLPPEILGLTDEQVEELHLVDEWGEKCVPSGGWTCNKDPIGRRNGKQPNEKMQQIVQKTVQEAKTMVSKKQVEANVCLTVKLVQDALDILRGAVMIVYPMNLPPHDVIRQEIENTEDLSGTQASLEVIELSQAQLWFCGKEMQRDKKLRDLLGNNEKTKVIVKLQKCGSGPPAREPVINEEDRKKLMLFGYRQEEQLKKMDGHNDQREKTAVPGTAGFSSSFCSLSKHEERETPPVNMKDLKIADPGIPREKIPVNEWLGCATYNSEEEEEHPLPIDDSYWDSDLILNFSTSDLEETSDEELIFF